MDTLNRIMLLIKENGIEQQGLAAILGINKQTISDWKSGKSKTYLKYIQTISDYFNVSTDYLLGRTDIKNPPAETEGLIFHIKDDNLRAEVDELVSIYLSLDNAGRTLVLAKAIEESRIQAAVAAKQINETA